MGIPIEGLQMMNGLNEVIDWRSKSFPITTENTQKVIDFIENYVDDSKELYGDGTEGPIRIKRDTNPFEVMTFIRDYLISDDQLCKQFWDWESEDVDVGCEWYERDKEWGRFPYYVIDRFFETTVTSITISELRSFLSKHNFEDEFLSRLEDQIEDYEQTTDLKIKKVDRPNDSECEDPKILEGYLRERFGPYVSVKQSLLNVLDSLRHSLRLIEEEFPQLVNTFPLSHYINVRCDVESELFEGFISDISQRWLTTLRDDQRSVQTPSEDQYFRNLIS